MDKYTVELYDWIATQDATFTKDVSFADFDKKISTDENYAKSMYNWISSIDNTFSSDVSEQDFIGKVKKKRRFSARFGGGIYGFYCRTSKGTCFIGITFSA